MMMLFLQNNGFLHMLV